MTHMESPAQGPQTPPPSTLKTNNTHKTSSLPAARGRPDLWSLWSLKGLVGEQGTYVRWRLWAQ